MLSAGLSAIVVRQGKFTVTKTFFGSYSIEARRGEIERFNIQSAALELDTDRMLDLIGVGRRECFQA